MKTIHRIFKKTAEYKSYKFAKVDTVVLFWQLLSSILITNFCQSFDDLIAIGYSAHIALEEKKSLIKLCVIKTSRNNNRLDSNRLDPRTVAWLLLTFVIYLHNQLSYIHNIITYQSRTLTFQKIFLLFDSMIAFQKWWKMLFTLS